MAKRYLEHGRKKKTLQSLVDTVVEGPTNQMRWNIFLGIMSQLLFRLHRKLKRTKLIRVQCELAAILPEAIEHKVINWA